MAKRQFIHELDQGVIVDSRFCILNPQSPSGNGPYKFILRDRTGDMPALMWRSTGIDWPTIAGARYADIQGIVQYSDYSKRLEIRVDHFQAVEDPGNVSHYLPRFVGDSTAHRQELYDLVKSIATPTLQRLLDQLFRDEPFRRAYFDAPAAQHMHHPYIGGLLVHSLEVARICDAIAAAIPGLNRDLLVTAALLHDIGKIDEIDFQQDGFPFTRSGGMLGHVFLGAQRVYHLLTTFDDCPRLSRRTLSFTPQPSRPVGVGSACPSMLPGSVCSSRCRRLKREELLL
jgi:3'-5' exoribonuclease